MNMLLIIMSIIAMLTIVGISAYGLLHLYGQRRGANDPTMEVPAVRPRPIINTEYGPVTPLSFEYETRTSGNATVKDGTGRFRTLSNVNAEELHEKNVLHNVFGTGPAEYNYTPSDHAQREHARYAARAGGVVDTMNFKHKFDMAQTDAVVEHENTDLELEKSIERAQALIRANPTVVKK